MTKDEIIASIRSGISGDELKRSVIYLSEHLLQEGTIAQINNQPVPIEHTGILVFADLQPGANWAHPCRYLLIDKSNRKVKTYESHFPPAADGYKVLVRGENVENWMLM